MEQALTLKYRPGTWEEVYGNHTLIKSLRESLRKKKIHLYLLHGSRGTGKTTLARLMAKELEIAPMAIAEIDAADRTGIADARQLKRDAYLLPSQGNKKMYIIDECHRLSVEAQDSLLKILEEPPVHVYFVLCTTDINKLSKTIRSRCTAGAYQTQGLAKREAMLLLSTVADTEEIETNAKVLRTIFESCEGIPREMLGTLERIRHLDIEEQLTEARIGTMDDVDMILLIKELLKPKPSWKESRAILKVLTKKDGFDPERARINVMEYLASVLVNSDTVWMSDMIEELLDVQYKGRAGFILAICRCCNLNNL